MFNRHVFKDLSAYLDNQLTEKKKLKIEQHLKDCQICSQELAKLKLLSQKLKAWQAPELDSGFENAVKNEIVAWELQKGETKMEKKTLAILIPSGVLAGVLVFLFVGNLYMSRGVQGRFGAVTKDNGLRYDMVYDGTGTVTKKNIPVSLGFARRFGDDEGRKYEGRWSTDYAERAREETVSVATPQIATGAGKAFNGKAGEKWNMEYQDTGETGGREGFVSGEGSVIVIQPTLPATGQGEKIIRTAEVMIEVEDGKIAYKQANAICQELGGYLASSNFYKDSEAREAGTITMRIPKDKFLVALEKLGALGKIVNSSTNSQDVGQEYANLKARLDAAMVVYNKTLEALQKRQTTIPEAMRLESELTPILQRVEELKNQIEYLNNAVSFTTITLNFHEPQVSAKVLRESKNYIKESMLMAGVNSIKFLARAIPAAIVSIICAAILVVVALLIKYLITHLFKRG